ncbi:MAG TPA: FAD-dependent monooxygenase [Nannocystis sp.]|jgi:2-polyprenyl-6-methoxyphenol hydroxylase-like FAD-dependent oxidoreductase
MTHAIIIGGGIAGPVTALALQRAGVTSTVYEAHAGRDDAGGWLTIAVNGLAALRSLDLHRPVMAAGFPTTTIGFLSGTGKPLGAVPIGGVLADGTVTHTLRRSELHRVLREELQRRGPALERGKRLVSAQEADGGVVARFADGSEARGDLLIGADGIHSRVRQILDPGAPRPRYTGLGNMGGFTPAGRVDVPSGACTMVFGRRCFFGMVVAPDGEVWWFANPPRTTEIDRGELQSTSDEQWRERLAAMFDGDRTPAAAVIRASLGPVIAGNQYDLPSVPVWRRGKLLIVGDAAHAAGPSSGQGASMAIEDAVVLARCMREHAEIEDAFAAYEQGRRARVERVVAHGARVGSTKTVGPLGRVLRDLMLPLFLRRAAREQGSGSMAWLFEHHAAV